MIYWMANTKEMLTKFPGKVRKEIGFALYCEEINIPHPSIHPLKGLKQTVREIKSGYKGDAYRTVYAVNLGDSIYVLHVFQKKSKRGKTIPKPDMDLIRKRLKQAVEQAKEAEA